MWCVSNIFFSLLILRISIVSAQIWFLISEKFHFSQITWNFHFIFNEIRNFTQKTLHISRFWIKRGITINFSKNFMVRKVLWGTNLICIWIKTSKGRCFACLANVDPFFSNLIQFRQNTLMVKKHLNWFIQIVLRVCYSFCVTILDRNLFDGMFFQCKTWKSVWCERKQCFKVRNNLLNVTG